MLQVTHYFINRKKVIGKIWNVKDIVKNKSVGDDPTITEKELSTILIFWLLAQGLQEENNLEQPVI